MRHFSAFPLLGLAVGLAHAAHAQQPFERFGFKVKVATLSNGRYPEFFHHDSLRRIGSVVYNTRLRRIAYLLPADSLVGRAKPEVTSRWMSPDPLAEKYLSISPYVFAADNPIRYMDKDGREIVDPKGNAAYVQSKDGSYTFTKFATQEIRTFVTELSKNNVGIQTLASLVSTATKVGIEITSDRGIGKDADGNVKYLEGQTEGRGSMIDPKTGKTVYKTAEITIYAGEHANEATEGKGQYSKSSLGKFINGIGVHEATHALDQLENDKQVAKDSGAKGKELQTLLTQTHEDKPNEQERKANATYPAP